MLRQKLSCCSSCTGPCNDSEDATDRWVRMGAGPVIESYSWKLGVGPVDWVSAFGFSNVDEITLLNTKCSFSYICSLAWEWCHWKYVFVLHDGSESKILMCRFGGCTGAQLPHNSNDLGSILISNASSVGFAHAQLPTCGFLPGAPFFNWISWTCWQVNWPLNCLKCVVEW